MRRIINLFKEPIYKDDLLNAVVYGLLHMVLFSILGGAIQFFVGVNLGVTFSIVIYMVAYMIGKGIADKISTYHILYSLLSVIFFVFGYLIYKASFYAFVTRDIMLSIKFIFSFEGVMTILLSFLNINSYSGIGIIYNIIDIIFIVFCFITAWRLPQRRG